MSDTPTQVTPSGERTLVAADGSTPRPAEAGSKKGAGWPVIPGYEILGELGSGGMGRVYEARQLSLNRVVALKTLVIGGEGRADLLRRFRREAETVAGLRHPNVVQVFEFGEQGGLPWFAMERVPGVDLGRKLRGTPVSPPAAAALVETLARTMHDVHTRGQVLHRDLKPQNVLVVEPGPEAPLDLCRPVITDFGLAKPLDNPVGRTPSVAFLGTPGYMAPELAMGALAGPLAATVDVYSLGAILYECLSGRPPFRAETPLDMMLHLLHDEPTPLRKLQPGVPRDLETICLKCLEKKPRQRYPTALALADELQRFRTGEPIRARPIGPVGRWWRWAQRNPRVALLAVALVLVVVAGFAGVTWQWRQAEENRQKAEENLRAAVGATLDLVDTTTEEGLSTLSGKQLRRKQVLHKALHAYRDLSRRQGDNPDLQLALGRCYQWLGIVELESGTVGDSLEAFRQAEAVFQRLFREHPDFGDQAGNRNWLGANHYFLGHLHRADGHPEQALEDYRQALAVWRATPQPSDAWSQWNEAACRSGSGDALLLQGRAGEALRGYVESRQIMDDVARAFPAHAPFAAHSPYQELLSDIDDRIGRLHLKIGQPQKALDAFLRTRQEQEALVRSQRDQMWWRFKLARTEMHLGIVSNALGRPADARRVLNQAREALEPLVSDNDCVTDFRRTLAETHLALAGIERQEGRNEEALQYLARCRPIGERLLAEDPAVIQNQVLRANICCLIGVVRRAQGQPDAALDSLQIARAVWEKLRADHPEIPWFRSDLAAVCREIGDLQCERGRPQAARPCYDQAVQLQEGLVRESPEVPAFRRDLEQTRQELKRVR